MPGARVIGMEIVPEKVRRARAYVEESGLGPWAEIREGDARETLRELPHPVDLLLLESSGLEAGLGQRVFFR